MPYEPIVPDGHHLGTSHEVDGAVTGHLFEDGTNSLKGHVPWRWIDDPEESVSSTPNEEPIRELTPEERELIEAIAALILTGVVLAVTAASPHIKRWWNDSAAPRVKSAWKSIAAPFKPKAGATVVTPERTSHATFVASSTGVEIAVANAKVKMNRAEWDQRFQAMLAAGAFKEKQLQILSNARIEDGEAIYESHASTDQLTPQQFVDRIKRMLEANPSLLDDDTSIELIRVFSTPSKHSIGVGDHVLRPR